MKRTMILFLFFCLSHASLNASTFLPVNPRDPMTSDVMIPLVGTNKMISLKDYLNLTPQDYADLTGKKMKLGQKIDLNISKHFIKKMIRKDGTVDIQKMKKRGFFSGWQWHWGGFALGFFFSFLGVIATLFFNDDYKWDRFWTALHTALWLGLIAGIVASVIAGGAY
jgi:hypothetical protein